MRVHRFTIVADRGTTTADEIADRLERIGCDNAAVACAGPEAHIAFFVRRGALRTASGRRSEMSSGSGFGLSRWSGDVAGVR